MKHLYPPIKPHDELRPPVLVIAAHPDDEVIPAGATLYWHRYVGHDVTVVHLTDGAAGDPERRYDDISAVRKAEGREALARLGVDDVRTYDYPDGELFEHLDAATETVRDLIREIKPNTLYSFFFTESHADHRAVSHAVAGAADVMPDDLRVLLFGVNQVVVGGVMFDCSEMMEAKQWALAAYESQLAYNNFKPKILGRDNAATVNVEDPKVQYAELFADLRPDQLARARDLADELYRFLLHDIE